MPCHLQGLGTGDTGMSDSGEHQETVPLGMCFSEEISPQATLREGEGMSLPTYPSFTKTVLSSSTTVPAFPTSRGP